jgi:hypothetical protein
LDEVEFSEDAVVAVDESLAIGRDYDGADAEEVFTLPRP